MFFALDVRSQVRKWTGATTFHFKGYKMKFSIRSVAAAAAGLALAVCVGSASATPVPTFTINQGAIPGGPATTATGDQFSGTSSELLTFNGTTGNTGSGWLQINALNLGGTQTAGFGNLFSYGLFVTFNLADTYVGGGSGPNTAGANNIVTLLNYQIWADPGHNNVFTGASTSGTTGTAASYTGGGDDILLGFGSLINGVDGINALGGAFLNSTQTIALCTGAGTATVGGTAIPGPGCANGTGHAFFIDPVPFFSLAFTEFNNTQQGITFSTNGQFIAINQATGSVDFNRVPEPGSMALFGLALAGLAVSVRRSKKSNCS